ncbi:MAG: aldo/keto reductase [Acetobacteraceae bacterium]|nr:aldo/keto reductase [Acetobacteraceae bacterium]
MTVIPAVKLSDGTEVPAIGQGTWRMGERRNSAAAEEAALRLGIDCGMTLIDTAEMYGEGGSEEVVGRAIAGRRGEVFLVSKVYPHNASRAGVVAACERSLKRLKTDRLDLYLLHWRGSVPLAETVEGFERLRRDGKIARWGVSNLDVADMTEIAALPAGKDCATDQVLYNPEHRGIEFDLLPWARNREMPAMAYSPVGQGGGLLRAPALRNVARRHCTSPAPIAIAWAIRSGSVIAIPKAATPDHVRANAEAGAIALTPEDLAEIDAAFPPPARKAPLGIL